MLESVGVTQSGYIGVGRIAGTEFNWVRTSLGGLNPDRGVELAKNGPRPTKLLLHYMTGSGLPILAFLASGGPSRPVQDGEHR